MKHIKTQKELNEASENLNISDVMVSLIGKKVKYNGKKYTITDYFNYTDLIMLDDEITISRIHGGIEWLN
jgi:hypothetical protein